MSKNNRGTALMEAKKGHFKMFKVNKTWIFASATILSVLGSSVVAETNAHADSSTTPDSNKTSSIGTLPSAKPTTDATSTSTSSSTAAKSVMAASASATSSTSASSQTTTASAATTKASQADVTSQAVTATSQSSQATSATTTQASTSQANSSSATKATTASSSVANTSQVAASSKSVDSMVANAKTTVSATSAKATSAAAKTNSQATTKPVSASKDATPTDATKTQLTNVKDTVADASAAKLTQTPDGELKVFVRSDISQSELTSIKQALANYQSVSGKSVEIGYDDSLATTGNVLTPTTKAAAKKLVANRMVVMKAATVTPVNQVTTNGNKTTIKPNDAALQQAIATAKANGVTVVLDNPQTQSVASGDVAKTLNVINASYADQIAKIQKISTDYAAKKKAYDTAYAKYQTALKDYQDAVNHPKYNNSTEWSEKTLSDFLGNPANVVYVSNSSKQMSLDLQDVKAMTSSQIADFRSYYRNSLDTSNIEDKYGVFVTMNQGDKFTYRSAFNDPRNGKAVDVQFTINKMDNATGLGYAYISKNYMGVNEFTPNMNANYKVDFFDHENHQLVKFDNILIGIGDIDATQYVTFDQNAAATLHGSNVVEEGNTYRAIDDEARHDDDQSTQVWKRFTNTSGISYTYGAGDNHRDIMTYGDDYHALGNIVFGLEFKLPPKEPTPPAPQTVHVGLTNLETVTPPAVTKVADNENKLMLAGQTMTQHISATTGLLTSDQFVLGDQLYYVNGKLPMTVNVADLRVVRGDQNSKDDQTGLFTLKVNAAGQDYQGNTVYDVSAVANNPSALGTGIQYTLNMVETVNIDHVADTDSDIGYSLVNGTYSHTDEHTYHEWTPTPSKNWVEGNQVVNGKTYIDGDMINASMTMQLPDQSQLTDKLSKVSLTDDFSKSYSLADLKGYDLFENGQDAKGLYTFTDDGQGHYTMTRKDASSTPAGALNFIGHWQLHADVPTGTAIANSGSGTINNDTVPVTPVDIVSYHPEAAKHWTSLDGNRVTDGMTYVAGDQVAFEVNVNIPADLANPLSNLQINDDYSETQVNIDVAKTKVFDNGIDITNLGKVVNRNGVLSFAVTDKANLVKLTAGPVRLQGYGTLLTTLKNGDTIPNHGSYTLNTDTVETNIPNIYVYAPQPFKSWLEGNHAVNGQTYIDGDMINASLSMQLPDQNKLNTVLSNVNLTADFSKAYQYADLMSYELQENGHDVKGLYTFTDDKAGHYSMTRKDSSTTPSGILTFVGHWHLHKDVPTGTQIINSGSGTINNETVPVPPVDIVAYHPEANKHWTSLDGNKVTDGMTYVAGDQVAFEVNAEIPANLANTLIKFQINDDYSEKQINVDATKTKVFDNGIDITNLGQIVDNNGVLSFVVTDAANLAKLTAGPVHLKGYGTLLTTLKSGDTIPNHGSYTLNTDTVETNIPNIYVYAPAPVKHWTDDQGKTTDNQLYLAGDYADASIAVTYPDQSKMSTKVTNLGVYDDYSAFDKYVTLLGADVFENGKNVTSEYTFVRSNGLVVGTRKDGTKAADNAQVVFVSHFKLNQDAPADTLLKNNGGAMVNHDKVPTTPVEIKVWHDVPDKDVEVGVVEGDSSATANGMTVVKGTVITYPLSAKDLPANRETMVTKEVRHDMLPDGVQYTGYKAYLKQADGSQKDVSNFYMVVANGQDIIATGTQALFDYYNADKSKALVRPVLDLYGTVTKDGATLVNKYTLTTNDDNEDSREVTLHTPVITPTKEVHNVTGADINGQNVARGDLLTYTMNMDLTDLKNATATKDQLAHGISLWDKYDKSRVSIADNDIHIYSPDGKTDLGSLFKLTNDATIGKFTVQTNGDVLALLKQYGGQKLLVKANAHVLKDVTGDLINTAFQDTFGDVIQTNTVINHIPQMNPTKDVVVNVGNQKSLDGQAIKLGDVFDYKLTASERAANYGGQTNEWSIADTLSDKDDYTGQYQVYATHDFVLPDGTIMEKGSDITEYFTSVYNPENNQVKLKAKQSYLDIINSAANKAQKMGWVGYVQCKRVGTGTVFNMGSYVKFTDPVCKIKLEI